MVTPKPDVDKHKYAENVEEQIIQMTNVKRIPSVLIVMVITLREAENEKLKKREKDQRSSSKRESRKKKSYPNTIRRRRNTNNQINKVSNSL